jgi:hypothetical protein
MARIIIYYAILLIVVGFAFRRGDRETRVAALICLFASVLSAALMRDNHRLEGGIGFVDLAVLGSSVVIALRSPCFWPLWVSGLQLTTVVSHLLFLTKPTLLAIAYAAAMRFWSYPILLILLVAAIRSGKYAEPTDTPA